MITLSPQLDWVSLSILNWEFPQILKLNHLIGIFFIWENPQFEMCYETEACPLFVVYSLSHNYQGDRVAQWVRSLDLTTHRSLSPIRRGFAPSFVNYKKGRTRLATKNDKVYQFLAQGRWFSPGNPASSTTKTGRHDIAEILLKVALNTKIQIHNYHYQRFLSNQNKITF